MLFFTVIKKFLSQPYIRQYGVVIAVNLNLINFGLSIAWSSPVLVKLTNAENSFLSKPLTDQEASWIVSIAILSGLVVNLIIPFLVDNIGRKSTLLLGSFPRLCSSVILAFGADVTTILVAKVMDGVASTIIINVVPIYASEIASKEIRGNLGAILGVFMSLGTVIMLAVGPFLEYFTLNLMMLLIAILCLLPVIFIPESPSFLCSKGKTEEAMKILTYLRGSETLALKETADSKTTKEDLKLTQVFKSKAVMKSLAIVVVLAGATPLTGAVVTGFYLQTILELTGTNISSNLASIFIGVVQMCATLCTSMTTDRFGRKPIIIASTAGMMIGSFGLGTYFKLLEAKYEISGFLHAVPVLSLAMITFFYAAGMGALLWPLTTELFEIRARAIGVASAQASHSVFQFLAAKYFIVLSTVIGNATVFWIFGFNIIFLMFFVIFFVPETKGKSFEEIQKKLENVE